MTELLQPLLAWIEAHPHGAWVALFVLAFCDSLLVIGVFVPTALPLFALGALVALGALDLEIAIAATAVGALAGDGLSFWLGRRYGEQLFAARFFRRHPELLQGSRRFLLRHGVLSIFFARFLGPMRAITPALAGAAGTPAWAFLLADIPAAALWATAFILPGVVFGASLGLAAEVAGRLAMLLLVLIVGVGALLLLTGFMSRLIARHGSRWLAALLDWSRDHRRLGRLGVALLDEDLPETRALAVLALLLLLAASALLYLTAGAGWRHYPHVLDASIVQWLQDLHTPWGIALARHLLELGSAALYGPIALVTLASLLLGRHKRAAAHWLAALGFGGVIALALHAVPLLPSPGRYFQHFDLTLARRRDFMLATVAYSFLPVLLATGRSPLYRRTVYGIAAVLLGLVLFAQLYLGVQWPSVAILLMAIGAIWTVLLGIGYRHHRPAALGRSTLPALLLLTGALCLGLRWASLPETVTAAAAPARALSLAAWQDTAYAQLPAQRQDVAGRLRQPLQLQWAGTLDDIGSRLRAAGWQVVLEPGPGLSLHWLARELPIGELPVLPRVHAGQHPALSLRLPLGDTRQYLLRLWPTAYQLDDGTPMWIGSVVLQETRVIYRLFRYPIAVDARPALPPLLEPLAACRAQRGALWLLWSCPDAVQP